MTQSLSELRQYLTKVLPMVSRIKPWALVAMALALVLLSYYGMQGFRYWRSSQQVEVRSAEVRQLSTIIDRRQTPVEVSESELDDQKLVLEDLLTMFEHPVTDDLIGITSRTAQEAGVHLASIGVGDVKAAERDSITYQTLPINITVEGETPDVYRFLALLHQRVLVIETTSIRFAGLDNDPTSQVQLVFFMSPDVRLEEEAG